MVEAPLKTGEDVPPNPGDLVESLRDFGYTLPSALADLIDNSLTAGGRRIEVSIEARDDDSCIAVVDDGCGMNQQTLVEAMRMGTRGPLPARKADDLGRFGLGLKTASLSQGRRLTVITKANGSHEPLVRRWDITHIAKTGRWQLLESATATGLQFVERIRGMQTGTAVVIEDLDRATFLRVDARDLQHHLGRTLDLVRRHLSMVFHRFIEDGVAIVLGSTPISAWDPFLRARSTKLPTERLPLRNEFIDVTPYVLPHYSRLTEEEHDDAAGAQGWNAHQGFYLYRCRRLIVPGSWLNLGLRNEEHYKLARIQVDLSNRLDADWQLSVTKAHVAAPASLRDDFARVARQVRTQAAEVYRFRGERQAPANPPANRFVWRRRESKGAIRYEIDRTHPVLRALLGSNCDHTDLLEEVLRLAERTIPIATMLQEPARSLDGSVLPVSDEEAERYVDMILHAEHFLIEAGRSPGEARDLVLAAEPFAQIAPRLRELIVKRINPDRP